MDYTSDPKKWDRKTRLSYQEEIRNIYQEAFESTAPDTRCINTNGSTESDCPCQHCTGARATHAASLRMTKPQEWDKLPIERKAFYVVPQHKRRDSFGRDLPADQLQTLVTDAVPSDTQPGGTVYPDTGVPDLANTPPDRSPADTGVPDLANTPPDRSPAPPPPSANQ